MRNHSTANTTAAASPTARGALAVIIASLSGLFLPLGTTRAQQSASMQVSVVVASAAPSASVNIARSSVRQRNEAGRSFVEVQSQLAVNAQTGYTMRVRQDSASTAGLQVRGADGRFITLADGSAMEIARADVGNRRDPSRKVDMVVRVPARDGNARAITLEISSPRLDM